MALTAGTRLGVYEVSALIGEGGHVVVAEACAWVQEHKRPGISRSHLRPSASVQNGGLGECEHAIDVESLALGLAAPLNLGNA